MSTFLPQLVARDKFGAIPDRAILYPYDCGEQAFNGSDGRGRGPGPWGVDKDEA
jgi:hypothetical protein